MTNRNFDMLDAKMALRDAKEAVATWGKALVRTDITETDLEFLSRSYRSAKAWQANQQDWLDRGAF